MQQRLSAGLWTGGFLGIAAICFLRPLKRSRKAGVLPMLTLFVIATMILGCGGGHSSPANPGTPAGMSTVTVMASSTSGTQHSVTIQLTVQ